MEGHGKAAGKRCGLTCAKNILMSRMSAFHGLEQAIAVFLFWRKRESETCVGPLETAMDVPVRDWFGSFLIAVNIGFAEIAVGHRIGCDIQGFWSDFQLISPVLLPCCRNSRAVRLTGACRR